MYIFGASGHGKVIANTLKLLSKQLNGFIDDAPKSDLLSSLPVVHSKDIKNVSIHKLIIGIGDNKIRKQVSEKFTNSYETLVHPSAVVCDSAEINEGTVVFANAVVNASANIGKHCIVNSGAIVEHDCVLEDFVHISPNATIAGNVKIGEGTHIGAGAIVIPNLTIGNWVKIGAGAVIIKNVPEGAVMVGNPARNIKQ